MLDGGVLADDRRQAHDHRRQRGLDVLVGVGHQLLDVRQNVLHDGGFAGVRDQLVAEVFHFVGDRGADLGFHVFQQGLRNKTGDIAAGIYIIIINNFSFIISII